MLFASEMYLCHPPLMHEPQVTISLKCRRGQSVIFGVGREECYFTCFCKT